MTLPNDPHDTTDMDTDANTDANDDRLDAALSAWRSLPRETASDDFTDQVLRRLPANDHRPHPLRNPGWLVAAALVLVAVGFGLLEWRHQRRQTEAIERIAALRAEYLVLEQELEDIRRGQEVRQVVYLGEVDGTEVVLDLAKLPDDASRAQALRLLQAGLLTTLPSEPADETGVRTAAYQADASSSRPVYY